MVGPIAHDKADNLLPVSKAAFAEVRATNAALRASDASLEASNAQNVAVLDAAEAKLQELFPVRQISCLCNALSPLLPVLLVQGAFLLDWMSSLHD